MPQYKVRLDDIFTDSGLSSGSQRNYRSTINAVNDHFGWSKDKVHYSLLNNHADEVLEFVKSKWDSNKACNITNRLMHISSLMTRTGRPEPNKIKQLAFSFPDHHTYTNQPKQRDVPDWNDLVPTLDRKANESSGRNPGNILCLVMSYGYVLRVSELFDTKLENDDGIHNFLDLDKGTWLIRQSKNHKKRLFEVDPDLIDELKTRFNRNRDWLICKKNGTPYTSTASRILNYHVKGLPNNSDIRGSFETWNYNNNKHDVAEYWSYVLGHSSYTSMRHYVRE